MTYSNMWPRGDWARRHLNWTLLLYTGLAYIPSFVLVLAASYRYDNEGLTTMALLYVFVFVCWAWYLMVWNLRHKGRRLWNLLYLLIPWVGGIVFLCIRNRDQLAKWEVGQRSMVEGGRY